MAASMDDVIKTVKYARDSKKAIAVRTGGHQYSGQCIVINDATHDSQNTGASSTSRANIQLDLSTTFKSKPDDLQVIPTPADAGDVTLVRTSVSWSLGDFLGFLTDNHLFVPTGQCTDVHLGGHVQTGGYGQLARSFGLLGTFLLCGDISRTQNKIIIVTITDYPRQATTFDHFRSWISTESSATSTKAMIKSCSLPYSAAALAIWELSHISCLKFIRTATTMGRWECKPTTSTPPRNSKHSWKSSPPCPTTIPSRATTTCA